MIKKMAAFNDAGTNRIVQILRHQNMQQIEVDIANAQIGELLLKEFVDLIFRLDLHRWKLRCNRERIPWMALNNSLSYCFFAVPVMIHVARVKIGEPFINEEIYHLVYFL